jgi:hypothetical protein
MGYNITSLTIGDGITGIGRSAFANCRELTSVTVGASVSSFWIDSGASFGGCTNLERITVDPANTTYSSSFDGIWYKKTPGTIVLVPKKISGSITIPEGITTIVDGAFDRCPNLTSVSIPSSVTSIGKYTFTNCTSLTSINVSPLNREYSSVDGVLFSRDKKLLIQYPAGHPGTAYTIPSSVETIGALSFEGCTALASVIKPNSKSFPKLEDLIAGVPSVNNVSTIGYFAFEGCTSLTSVTFGGSAIYDNNTYASALTDNLLTFYVAPGIKGAIELVVDAFMSSNFDSYGRGFYDYAFPSKSSASHSWVTIGGELGMMTTLCGDSLKTAYLDGGAGTYTRAAGGSTWTKQ